MAASARGAPNFYRQDVVEEVQTLLEAAKAGQMPPQTAFGDVLQRLRSENIVRDGVKLSPDQVFVNRGNRGGLGINWYNVHFNGKKIVDIGVDTQELQKGSVAFSLSPLEPMKSDTINFNNKLIKNSKGLLADLAGVEQYASVGKGHTTQFIRAIKAGCRTPVKGLQDVSGKLNAMTLGAKDPRLKEALDGWEWTIIPWEAEVTWPGLADLAQKCLNANQNVASLMSELEVACAIADYESDMSIEDCTEAIAMNNPPCKAFARAQLHDLYECTCIYTYIYT